MGRLQHGRHYCPATLWRKELLGFGSCFLVGVKRGKESRNIAVLQVTVPPARTAVTTKEMHFLTLLVGA